MILIGSRAAKARGVDLGREPRDWDLIGTWEEHDALVARWKPDSVEALGENKSVLRKDGEIIEFEFAWEGSSAGGFMSVDQVNLRGWCPSVLPDGTRVATASIDDMLTLKLSHRYLKNSPHFLKTMRDIKVLRSEGAEVRRPGWLKQREKETYTYKHPKLMGVKKDDFFKGDGVQYVYDHDSIHVAMKHLAQPAYTYFLDGPVQCSRKKFDESPMTTRLFSVVEEALVLALERSVVPHPGVLTPEKAFKTALMKVCTSITSGWWREFAWESYDAAVCLWELLDRDYVGRFESAVREGVVKRL